MYKFLVCTSWLLKTTGHYNLACVTGGFRRNKYVEVHLRGIESSKFEVSERTLPIYLTVSRCISKQIMHDVVCFEVFCGFLGYFCRNVFFLAECFPRFVEEYNFIMQTLFHAPKMPSAHFYDGLLKLGLEETMQYFRMSDAERSAIWDGWTEEGPKKPRRRAEIDFFKLVTDASVRDGDVLKMPHPENRIVLRGANLIVDSRNTEHHFYARVFSRGSGKNNVVNNIVFNKASLVVALTILNSGTLFYELLALAKPQISYANEYTVTQNS